jgi:hypothetical protein
MRKIIFIILTLLFTALGCACSPDFQTEDETKSLNGSVKEEAHAVNDEITNMKLDDTSVADSYVAASDVIIDEKRIIQDQSFNVELNDWGSVRFISYEPDYSVDFEDVSFFLMRDNKIVYSFPYFCENNTTENYVGLYDSVAAVGFRDVNNDNVKDVIVIINYVTGAGPQGMIPRPRARIFFADNKEFYLATDLISEITDNIEEQDLSVSAIVEYIKNKS